VSATNRVNLDDDDQPQRPLRLREVLRRRRWWALLAFLACFTAAVTIASTLPDVYRSAATILIERQQIPDELVRSTVTSGLDVRIQTISQEILSRSRLEGLITQFGLYPDLRGRTPTENIIDRMRGEIQIEMRGEQKRGDRSAVAFSVGYRGRDPSKVAAVANAVASFYIEENLKARERQASGTAEFLRTQLNELKARLAEQEAKVSAFKEKNLGELPQQLDANLKTLEQLNGQLRLNSDNQVQANARRAAVESQVAEALGLAGGGPDALATRLGELRKLLTVLRTQYTDQYPDVIRVRAQIAKLEAQLAAGGGDSQGTSVVAVSPQVLELRRSLSEADVDLKRLRAEEERLRSSIALYQRRVEAAPKREQEFQALSREYQSTQEQYRSLVGRLNEADLAESMEQRQKGEIFRVIEPAVPDEQPAAPRRGRILLLGLLLSLALATGLVIVLEALDASVHTHHDVETCTPLPVLVTVPVLLSQPDRQRRQIRFIVGTVAALAGMCAILGVSFWLARANTALSMWVSR
jgi:succinoglycan biosynthesis transport protein ExoP